MGAVLLSALLIGVMWTTSQVPLYTTSATLLIEEPVQILPENDDIEIASPRYYQTQVDLLSSPAFVAHVITSLRLGANPVFLDVPKKRAGLNRFRVWLYHRLTVLLSYGSYLLNSTPRVSTAATPNTPTPTQDRPELVSLYLSLLSITSDPYSSSVEVAFTTPDAALSQELANAHAQIFVRTAQTTQVELTAEGQTVLEQQRVIQQERLTQVQTRAQQFRQAHPDTPLPGPENLAIQRLLDVYRRLSHARIKRLESETLRRLIEQNDPTQFPPFIKNDRVTQLQSTLAKLEAEHTRLATMLSPSHPRLKTLSTIKQTTQQTLTNERTTLLQTLEAENAAAVSAEALLQEEAEQQQKPALARGDFATVLAALTAEVDSYQTLLESLRQQQQDGVIFKAMANSQVTLTATAELPLSPVSPQPRQDLLFALMIGLASAVGLGFVAEWLDTSVRTSQDVWLATAYPTLGIIPPQASRLETLRLNVGRILRSFARRSDQAQTEAALPTLMTRELVTVNPSLIAPYHILGNTLPLLEGRKSLRTFLLTSPGSREGKTVTTLNLAISLAWSDFNVVVVDADLRSGHRRAHRDPSSTG